KGGEEGDEGGVDQRVAGRERQPERDGGCREPEQEGSQDRPARPPVRGRRGRGNGGRIRSKRRDDDPEEDQKEPREAGCCAEDGADDVEVRRHAAKLSKAPEGG